eukprot:CAMPEP_0183710254 /NCGR_PEP_ID=MMETSP0737-20130205/6027_1 /TAXON_ID=385413 /ORGANISM="Thalassiosira miniscula, Strain CCMP1093" /LENGTH=317 /DNA_ID=CAMNT_0025938483 /DNA_START=76 /DNA_END=1029 /DNA_ORIENTATION=+
MPHNMKTKPVIRRRKPSSRRGRAEVLLLSMACLPLAAALITIRPAVRSSISPLPLRVSGTELRTKRDNYDADDFGDFGREDDEARELAREFYQELELRRSRTAVSEGDNDDETYSVRDQGKSAGSSAPIKTVRISANPNVGSRFTNQRPSPSSQQSSPSPAVDLFSFLSIPAPFFLAPRPAASAGLFSGSGTTVYSSGRSVRAEIEILETTMKNNDDAEYDRQHREELVRSLATITVLLIIAYTVGGVWDEAMASAGNALGLMNEAIRMDGFSNIVVSVGQGDVFLGEEAAWLMKESAGFASSVVDAVRSVEGLVLL